MRVGGASELVQKIAMAYLDSRPTLTTFPYLKNHCASIDPRFKPSMTIIKYWAKLNELSTQFSVIEESTDLYISNYALEMLFLFYLQQPNVYLIPPITTLKMNCRHPEFVNGWQINIDETIQHPSADNKILIPELLWGFFKFYAEFDFEQFVICPLDGCAHSREAFQNINELPESMNSYKEYIQNTRIAFLFDATKPLCIQDPIVLNENCCKRVSSNFVTSFKEHADRAASICEIACINEDHSNLLQNLFETSYKNNDLD
ncbi:speckle targeted PIP5K1A-regulated poly(A) polymerase-like [Leptopilina heterotoma]|uniref:speckle targeted PIP5K1A-regulated poly(A) polymerase-like n=1 Tax=Leptopilina heterotoma TaxID=63436 RepID=UPI001CA8F16D|nr:speckle targeted PIP5K1A-regulated poly(A) polymerase-like [Leptopilina heterotoma]